MVGVVVVAKWEGRLRKLEKECGAMPDIFRTAALVEMAVPTFRRVCLVLALFVHVVCSQMLLKKPSEASQRLTAVNPISTIAISALSVAPMAVANATQDRRIWRKGRAAFVSKASICWKPMPARRQRHHPPR